MDCKGFEDLISAYADGETTGEEAQLVEAHLKACRACGRRLAFIRRSKDILASMPAPEAPADLKAALRVAAAQAEARSRAEPERPGSPSGKALAAGALAGALPGRAEPRPAGPTLLDRTSAWMGTLSPRYGLAFGLAAFLLVGLWFERRQDDPVPIDVMLSAHRRYALAQPLARTDSDPGSVDAPADDLEDDETDD
ncbi:MAG: zf-HC2 domain-containing protein [Elusimicrobia bacterium]|nr:zf-HC2 domain-containing protein [Elusimicrobiota bacterium]